MSKTTLRFFDDPRENAEAELILGGLLTWPSDRLRGFIAFFEFWRDLDARKKTAFAKIVRPELSQFELARLCGRKPDTVRKYTEYKRLKGIDAHREMPRSYIDGRKPRNGHLDVRSSDDDAGDDLDPR